MPDVAEVITQRFIDALERGTVPWQKPWSTYGRPVNFSSKRHYNGINMLMLGLAGYEDPRWGTYKQIEAAKGNVKKGEKGWPVVFFKILPAKKDEETGEMKSKRILRYTTAFNVTQCEGLDLPVLELPNVAVDLTEIDTMIDETGIKIQYEEDRAYYAPTLDFINLPKVEAFHSTEERYATAFHELVHATGHPSRLDRFALTPGVENMFGGTAYSKEELVAEIGASILCAEFAIDTDDLFENSAAYIASWLKKLKDNKNMIMSAARKAEDAVAFIHPVKG